MPANDVSGLMDALGFPPELHADAAALIAEIARRLGGDVAPTVAAFLGRSLHGVELQKNGRDPFVTFNAQLVADWSWESSAGEGLDALIAFADDTSDRVFLLDPTDSLGFGAAAVHSIEKGSGLLEDLVLVARSLSDFLSIYAGDARPVGRRVFDLRDEQTAAHPPPPRLGGGTELPADAVSDPRFFPKLDILRSVNLTQPLLLAGVTYLPDLDRTGRRRQPDLRFFRSGRVARGLVAGGSLGGFAVAANSRVSWSAAGELVGFLPAEVAIVRGIPCRPGTPVVAIGPTLTVTPDVDVEHRGFPCKAGTQIEDYGTVISFTAARAFQYAGRTIPDGVRVQTTDDGGVRFDLIADFVIDGRTLHAGTHVWYEADGAIRQIDARDGR